MRRLGAKTTASLTDTHGPRARSRWLLLAVVAVLASGAATAVMLRGSVSPDPAPSVNVRLGGETVMAKFAQAKTQPNLFAEPTPVGRLLSMALAPGPTITAPPSKEPNLAGLSEIPSELIWNRPPEEEEKNEKKRGVLAAFSKVSENLPWDAVEPVPFSPVEAAKQTGQDTGAKTPTASGPSAPVQIASADIGKWLKAKVTEIKGSDRSRPLYHFELWLEPPAAIKGRLVGVSYAFSSPAIRPQSQSSSDRGTGFRISAGGLACADEIELTLRFDDGREEKVSVDGCKLLS
jgi:hypothetical protein